MRRFNLVLMLSTLLSCPSLAADYEKKYYVPFRTDSLEHFGLGAGGTYVGSQVLQFWGMSLGPAVTLSALASIGANLYKEYGYDYRPGVNDLIAGTLGTLVGTLVSVKWSFKYRPVKKTSSETTSSQHPAWSSRLSLVQRKCKALLFYEPPI